MNPTSMPEPSPAQRLMMMSFSHAPAQILSSSVQLGVYQQLAGGPRTAAELARAIAASEKGTRMLLDSLVGLELLAKKDGRYELTPITAKLLVPSSPDYMGGFFESERMLQSWAKLTDVVRSGKPVVQVGTQQAAEEFFPILVKTLHVAHGEQAAAAAKALGAGTSHKGLRVVDVACGSGVWGIAVAQADPEARVTAQDFPKVLELTRQYVERNGLGGRYEYLAGDLKTADFGENRFDLALLGHIVHSEGETSSRKLFARLSRALRPGGRVAIFDMIPNEQRTGPPFPLFFALNMLLHTDEGDVYTLAQYTEWLQAAGFGDVKTAEIGSHSPMLLASKPN